MVGGREARLFELAEQLGCGLVAVDPPEELPDRAEVVDVVDERRAREGEEQRVAAGRRLADAVGECEHVLRALRLQVLDEVRLVDHHAAEAHRPEPRHVPVEHVVVHDDDVGERVEGVAVAWMTVARRCGVHRSTSRAQFIFTTFGTTARSG